MTEELSHVPGRLAVEDSSSVIIHPDGNESEAACPKGVSVDNIAKLNRDYMIRLRLRGRRRVLLMLSGNNFPGGGLSPLPFLLLESPCVIGQK